MCKKRGHREQHGRRGDVERKWKERRGDLERNVEVEEVWKCGRRGGI